MKRFIVVPIVGLAILLTACPTNKKTAQATGQAQTEAAFSQQRAAVPYPVDQLRNSLERANLRDRLLRTNKADAIGYVYLMSFGRVIGYYTIKGKVSSTQSQMTTTDLTVPCRGDSSCVVAAPGDDGSYGLNEPGEFFFTTEGAFVETSLEYIWSDQPLPIDVPRLNKK